MRNSFQNWLTFLIRLRLLRDLILKKKKVKFHFYFKEWQADTLNYCEVVPAPFCLENLYGFGGFRQAGRRTQPNKSGPAFIKT